MPTSAWPSLPTAGNTYELFVGTTFLPRSPLELPALINACARRQLELWIEQTRAFSNLAQKIEHVVARNDSGKTFKEAA